MKTPHITITLNELQEALNDYAFKKGVSQPEVCIVESYDKPRIVVELYPGGLVTATAFRHRSEYERL